MRGKGRFCKEVLIDEVDEWSGEEIDEEEKDHDGENERQENDEACDEVFFQDSSLLSGKITAQLTTYLMASSVLIFK